MKLLRMLGRGIRDASKSVIRNFSLSMASISCISITLMVVALALVVSLNVDNFTNMIESDVTMVIFLEGNATTEDVDKVSDELEKIKNIESITFKSKKEQQEEMMKEDEVFETIMSDWDEDESSLRDSFLVKVVDLEKIEDTAKKVKKIDKIDNVNYGEEMVDRLLGAFDLVKKITIAMVVTLIIVTIFLIINTIKLTIFSRKREISIMRLVGASNATIKLPFVIEGMIIGAIGSVVPILLVIYGYVAMYNHLGGIIFSNLIKLITPEPFVYIISLVVLITGIIVGMLGSARAVRKYLKV